MKKFHDDSESRTDNPDSIEKFINKSSKDYAILINELRAFDLDVHDVRYEISNKMKTIIMDNL